MQSETTDETVREYYSYSTRLLDGTPERVRKSFFEARKGEDFRKTIGNAYFDNIDPKYRQDLIGLRDYLRNAYSTIIALHAVISDVEMCARMINRYPWHGTTISRGNHFEFVWSNFTNHCYIFEERTKQLGKHYNKLPQYFGGEKINVGPWVTLIKKELGEHIAFRGAHLHQWSRNYEGYEFFNMVDLVAPFDEKYKWAQKSLYRETKNHLKDEILATRDKMLNILLNLKPDPIAYILKDLAAFDNLLAQNEIQTSDL